MHLIDTYRHESSSLGEAAALQRLAERLGVRPALDWTEAIGSLLAARQPLAAASLAGIALQRWPTDAAVLALRARAAWQLGHAAEAEAILQRLLALRPDDLSDAQLLAQILRSQGRLDASTRALSRLDPRRLASADALGVVQFIKQNQREAIAYAFCCAALDRPGTADPALLAQAGMLALALGQFEPARTHLLAALAAGVDLNTWFVPQALANCQRYADPAHPDLQRLSDYLASDRLQPRARASVQFALAKAHDELGQVDAAVALYRRANAQIHALSPWREQACRSEFEQRRRQALPAAQTTQDSAIVPVFVVGLPRTGTTLVAEFLARHAGVRNRGELPLLDFIARTLRAPSPQPLAERIDQARALYLAHLQQDDAAARWYVDKNPLNFRDLDVVAALFPQARVIYCRRDPRDTAISLWTQYFAHDDYAFANRLSDIAAFQQLAATVMAAWLAAPAVPTRVIDYEALVAEPDRHRAELAAFVGLDPELAPAAASAAIQSASLWQARQPVYRSSVQRWRRYLAYLPELESLATEPAGLGS